MRVLFCTDSASRYGVGTILGEVCVMPLELSGVEVIDSDAHVNPPLSIWAEYLPAEYRDLGPTVEPGSADEPHDWVVFEGERTPFMRVNDMAGLTPEQRKWTGRLAESNPGGWDPDVRLKHMDADGISAAALFGGGPLASRNLKLYLASFHAYNQWLADFCSPNPKRLLGMAYIPLWDVSEAVQELHWAADHGLHGAVIAPFAQERPDYSGGAINFSNMIIYARLSDKRSYEDPEFDPFWQACSELAMPVHVHLGAADPTFRSPDRPDSRFVGQVRTKLAMGEVVAHFVMSGLLERYPGVKLVSVESGVGWMAFVAEYLDNGWRKHGKSLVSILDAEPSSFMDRQVYGTFLEDHVGVNNRNLKGGHNIMWSSDYPHSETTWPHSREAIDRSLGEVALEEATRMLNGAARELYPRI
jgi:predicted TIM-barrel fold metal-dependent hydrolase